MSSKLKLDALTAQVVASFDKSSEPRAKAVMEALTRHLHAFVREVAATNDEWETGIEFLTRTGQACTSTRQEFILLSDVLGVTMLVETINGHVSPDATDSTVLGPFHVVASPDRALGAQISPDSPGPSVVVMGKVRGPDGEVVPGARIDVWQADANGYYDVQRPESQHVGNGRALIQADDRGKFWFRTVQPSFYPIPTDGPVGDLLTVSGRHPYRPAHIHFIVGSPGYRELTTHIFVDGDPYLDSDAVFAVKQGLVVEFLETDDEAAAEAWNVANPFHLATVDIVLDRERAH